MNHICATLLVLCSAFSQPSTVYTEVSTHINEQDLFIHEVTMCAVEYNSMIEPYHRLPGTLVVAQSILESNWGKSRFAVEGNNLFGIKEYDEFEPHMHAKNSKTMVENILPNVKVFTIILICLQPMKFIIHSKMNYFLNGFLMK